MKGHYLIKRDNGYWYIIIRQPDGTQKWVSTKTKSKTEGYERFRTFNPQSTEEEAQELTISEFIELLKLRAKGSIRESTLYNYSFALNRLKEDIGDKHLSEITPELLDKYKTSRLKAKNSPTSINILLRAVKACLSRAVEWKLVKSNPMSNVAFFQISKLQPRYLTKEQFKKFLEKVEEPILKDVYLFGFYSGLRRSELINLRWYNVDFNNKQFTVANEWNFTTKNGKQRTIPLNQHLTEILQRRYASRYKDTNYVFQTKDGFPLKSSWLSHKFTEYRIKAKLNGKYSLHSLRHSFVSNCIMQGVDLFTIAKFVGHSDTSLIDKVYGHLTDKHQQDQIRKLDAL